MKKSERRALEAEVLAKQGLERPIDHAAGDARRESMKRAQDDLEEAGEQKAAETETYRLDPEKLKTLDYEIVQNLNSLDVTGALPEFAYCWVRFKSENGAALVDSKLTLSVRIDGRVIPCWEVVRENMPEARERKAVDGTRRLGDVLLMRCRREIYDALQKAEQIKAERRHAGAVSDFVAFGNTNQARKYGLKVHTDAAQIANMQSQGGRGRPGMPTDAQLRTGTVPGAEIGR